MSMLSNGMNIDFAGFTDEPSVDLKPDLAPPNLDFDSEYPCVVCGKEAGPYGGRGPKPKYCDEHKKGARKVNGTIVPKNSNGKMAGQAADALVQLNSFLISFTMLIGYKETASAMAERNDAFREQAFNALLTDPVLCSQILKAGTTSGKLALSLTYGMFLAGTMPYAVEEHKVKKAEKENEAGSSQLRAV
jgi:hypothetical protein